MHTVQLKNQLRQSFKKLVINMQLKNAEEVIILAQAKAYLTNHTPKIIGLYTPLPSEVNITPLHSFCQNKGIKTAYPAIENGLIVYRLVDDLTDLQNSTLGFVQPLPQQPLANPDLLIVPGIAFNKKGARLGRGMGHFDRYLSEHNPKTLALAFSWMLVKEIPLESHDKTVCRSCSKTGSKT